MSEPLPELPASGRLDIATAPAAMGWQPIVSRAGDQSAGHFPGGISVRDLLVWLMLTALIASGGWYGWRRQQAVAARLRSSLDRLPWVLAASREASARLASVASRLSGAVVFSSVASRSFVRQPAGDAATYGAEVLETRFANVAATVARVPRTLPLREVLDDEMRRVRHRLAAVSSGSDGAGKGRVTAPAFRVMLRDLERIERIAVSALRSLDGGKEADTQSLAMPVTPAEAYQVLGINGNVSDATLKKIVDALRMSWHPDLAADEVDRLAREERIKQINIASELIAAERRAA